MSTITGSSSPGALSGAGGKITTDFGNGSDEGHSVAVSADGKIVVAGRGWNGERYEFALVRYNIDGSLDTGFNGDGKLTLGFTELSRFFESSATAYSVVIQRNGKIVVAGVSNFGGTHSFAVARFDTDGSLDTGFSGDGKLTMNFGGGHSADAYSVAIQADDRIVVAGVGWDWDGWGGDTFGLARFNTDGSLDTSFSDDGKLTTDLGSGIGGGVDDGAYSVAVQVDGRIVAAGDSSGGDYAFALVRYKPDGSLDTTLSDLGKLTTSIGPSYDHARDLVLQMDGKIVVAGYSLNNSNWDFALARYNADGSLDSTFSNDGKVTTGIGSGNDYAVSVATQDDGKILVAGHSWNGSNFDFALVRYNIDGSLDATFSGDGKVTTSIGTSDDLAASVALQDNGKILVAGHSWNGSNYDFALVRYNVDGSLDSSFGAASSGDTLPPTVLTFSPANEVTGVAVSTNFVITFSEDIQLGTGTIWLKKTSGEVVATYNQTASPSNFAIWGATLTIDPVATLSYGTNYQLEFAQGSIVDLAGNHFAGTTTYSFTTVQAALPTKTADQIFMEQGGNVRVAGLVRVMADFAKAAYDLQTWEDPTINDYSPLASQAKLAIWTEGWVPLDLSLPALPSTSTLGSFVMTNKLSEGYYTKGNAAALVARSADAIVISFRGTNDSAEANTPGQNPNDSSNIAHPDQDQWGRPLDTATMADHYALFSDLINAVEGFVNPTGNGNGNFNGIKNIYVTGHSLGGAMALEYMSQNKLPSSVTYQAVTFAAPVFTTQSFRDGAYFPIDNRITQIEIDEDPVPASALTVPRPGKQILFFGDHTADEPDYQLALGFMNTDNHSMDYYRQITKSIDPTTWKALVDQAGDLDVLIGAASGPYFDPVSPNRSLNQYDTYFVVDGMASGYFRNGVNTINAFNFDDSATTALSPALMSGLPVFDGVNVPINEGGSDLSAGVKSYDAIYGGNGKDVITGNVFNDVLIGGAGDDTLDGGGGTDTAVFGRNRANYTVTNSGKIFTVSAMTGTDGTDTLTSVERIQFSDVKLTMDTDPALSGGKTALLVGAVLPGAMALDPSKHELLGAVIGLFDAGYTMNDLSGAVLRLPIWNVLTGQAAPSNTHIANYLLTNIYGHAPDLETLTAAVNALNTESFQGDWLAGLALSSASQTHIGLIGLGLTGIEYF